MTGSVAIDVSIGLILIFLLYSLLASTIQEMLSSIFAFRARILSQGIDRMLNDEPSTLRATFEHSFSRWKKFLSWVLSLFFYTKSIGRHTLSDRFYNVPLIKYQGASKLFRKPSYITTGNFSSALMQIFIDTGQGSTDTEKIKDAIFSSGVISPEKFNSKAQSFIEQKYLDESRGRIFTEADVVQLFSHSPVLAANKKLLEYLKKSATEIENALKNDTLYPAFCKLIREYQQENLLIEEETRKQLQSFYDQSKGDLDKFQHNLEEWFDNTMERVSGWYKKRTQIRLFMWGLILAMAFNIDTFQIVDYLSHDDTAREQAVSMAVTYLKNNQTIKSNDTGQALDYYAAALQTTFKDAKNANEVFRLSYPWQETETIQELKELLKKKYERFTQAKLYGHAGDSILNDPVMLQYDVLQRKRYIYLTGAGKVHADSIKKIDMQQAALFSAAGLHTNPCSWPWYRKIGYMFSPAKLISFLVAAVAISLGAPFWFDLLNKFINMRGTGTKPVEGNPNKQSDKTKQAAG